MVDEEDTSGNVGGVPTIAQLIHAHRDATGDTFRGMSARAEKHGVHVQHQTLAALSIEPPKAWPKATETISGLALALNTSERQIVLSFAKSLGLDVEARDLLEAALPPDFYTLPRTYQVRLIRIVEDMLRLLADQREVTRADLERMRDETISELRLAAHDRPGEQPPMVPGEARRRRG